MFTLLCAISIQILKFFCKDRRLLLYMSRTLHLFGTDWCAMMVPIQVIRWYRMQCYDGTDSCATVVPIRRYCQIALCKDCHYDYDKNKTKEKYNKLLNIKKNLEKQYSVKNELSECNLEVEISKVLLIFKDLKDEDLEGLTLNYNAVRIKQKIGDSCLILRNKIEYNVVLYFKFIQEKLNNLCECSNTDFELISLNIRNVYLKSKKKGLDQEKIFDMMINWIVSKAQCSQIAAEILISFFVQNCEVYDISQ